MALPKRFDDLPEQMKNEDVRHYYELLLSKKGSLLAKRLLDILLSAILLIIVSPLLLILAIIVKCTSKGPVFYRQVRVGALGQTFRILKFRTMVVDADKIGSHVTAGKSDPRITSAGRWIRATRLDEFPQIINVLIGQMTFVGARPEVETYVNRYEPWMMSTLLLPPGITGQASIAYRNEGELLEGVDDPDDVYIHQILPEKCRYNLDYLDHFSVGLDCKILIQTVGCVFH